jgi:hypothetical protein
MHYRHVLLKQNWAHLLRRIAILLTIAGCAAAQYLLFDG